MISPYAMIFTFFIGCGSGFLEAPSAITVDNSTPTTSSFIATAQIGSESVRPIPKSFLGMSHEWVVAQSIMGSQARGVNPVYRQLIGNLTAYGGGPMIIRIGGDSTDKTQVPNPNDVTPFAETYRATGAHFFLGVNLGSDDPRLAARQAATYLVSMPTGSLDAIEIGNEPENYPNLGYRPRSYSFNDYLKDYATWTSEIEKARNAPVTLMGPSWSYDAMIKNAPTFYTQTNGKTGIFSQHHYAGTICNGHWNAPDFLLSPNAATSGAILVAPYVQSAHSSGMQVRMGEINSISCGGQPGVSDTFSSALWAIDSMFEYANVGVDGVNWHFGNGGSYAAFSFWIQANAQGISTYKLTQVAPIYYGLLFFQTATSDNGRLLPVKLTSSQNIKIWATIGDDDRVRVVIINKEKSKSGEVSISAPSYNTGSIELLEAPRFDSKSGLTLGGQTFDGSTDGLLVGKATGGLFTSQGGTFVVNSPATSAMLLTLSK